MSDTRTFGGELLLKPGYAENRWQEVVGLFGNPDNPDPLLVSNFVLEEGSPPGANNIFDINRMLQTGTHIAAALDLNGHEVPSVALGVKHGNPCGASIHEDHETATEEMLDGDGLAIFGGSTMFNFPLSESVADRLLHHRIEPGDPKRPIDVVIAPEVDEGVPDYLSRKRGKLRIMTNPVLGHLTRESLDQADRFRYSRGGEAVIESNYTFVPDFRNDERLWLPGEAPDLELERSILLAWAIGSTSTSNTITLVRNGMLIGNGVGQQDRVSAARIAVEKARRSGHDTGGSVAYSDSFFPFKDGPQVLIDAGIQAIFTSTGSMRDDEVFSTFERGGIRVFALPDAEVRGFYH